jgi:hypothetical protein
VDLLSNDDGESLVVGLDTEWDVDLNSRREGVPDRRRTGIMQLAYNNNVWIFQVSKICIYYLFYY